MRARYRFLLATLAGLILGAIIHIVIILTIPAFTDRDVYGLLEHTSHDDAPDFISMPESGSGLPWMAHADPAVNLAVCVYDLRKGPYLLSVSGETAFQSVSFHAQKGNVYFAVTDQAQVHGRNEFIIATDNQMAQLVQSGDYDSYYSHTIKVFSPTTKGVIVLRSFTPYPSAKQLSENSAALAECHRLTAQDQLRSQSPELEETIPQDLLPPRRGGI
ncbi:DUF1254 domain-containing protein [Microvirga sp. W0021]|uniref:DUF1254 domain-containing protein n=1 Tax=Hohaiivirga grylli TaxID=3133970 RepID=A0ABV0BLK1_9HYPH